MRLAIDARELAGRPTGVGRYLAGLLREWTSEGSSHGHEIVVYAHRGIDALPRLPDMRILPGSGGTMWEQRDLARSIHRDGVDVLFSPAYSTPLFTRIPRVVALHDISFAARPEWFAWREGLRRRALARRAAGAATTVLTISEFSKSEIATRFGIASSKIRVIPPGIDALVPRQVEHRRDASAQVLFVGSIFNRRHVPELIKAFTRLASDHPDAFLHLVGDNRSHPHQDVPGLIASSAARTKIQWHKYASDDELRQLYQSARAFVFLSEYEGLGLTPLEALSAGVPSLLLDTPVARESCGRAALYVDRPAADRVATELERLLYDESIRRGLLAEAATTLARYDWSRSAHETMKALEDAR